MPGKHYPFISKRIWILLFVFFLIGFFGSQYIHSLVAWPFWLLIPLLAFYYRDPERLIPSQPLAIVSPVDARVVAIDTLPNPYIEGDSIRIELKMAFSDVFRVRSPTEGKVINAWHLLPGDPLPIQQGPVSSLRISHWIQTDEGDNIVISIRNRSRFFHPQCDIQTGERIGQGQRCGMIEFGAMIDVFIPVDARLEVVVGDRVKSGSTVLAQLHHAHV
ncbi:MAG: hypothetical protein GXP13_09085 [Gammaproteobacteria bacterium]|nr:hypothetical protein [Gammaproteobacteria bacterium]